MARCPVSCRVVVLLKRLTRVALTPERGIHRCKDEAERHISLKRGPRRDLTCNRERASVVHRVSFPMLAAAFLRLL